MQHDAFIDSSHIDYSVVVPVYRGHDTLVELCDRLVKFFDGRTATYEIILVDDASTDGSWHVICDIARCNSHIIGVRLMRNFGQHNATNCGLARCKGDFVITLDEDMQHPPEEIEKLIECQRIEDSDVVYGIPFERQHRWWRRAASRLVMLIPRYVMKINFDISPFRLIRKPIADTICQADRHDIIIDVYLSWTTSRITATSVKHHPSRPSGYTVFRLFAVMIDLLCNYTVTPLRFSALTGLAVSFVSFLAGTYYIISKFLFDIEPGFTSVIVVLFFSAGLILLAVGALSEYVARIFLQVNRKPQWVVRENTNDE